MDPANDRNDPNHGDCARFAEPLTHLVLGEHGEQDEPGDAQRAALEAHLAGCADCRAERELLVKSLCLLQSEGTRAAPLLELSVARRAVLLDAAAGAAAPLAPVRRFWNRRRLAAAAAVIVAVGAGSAWSWRQLGGLRRDFAAANPTGVAANGSSASAHLGEADAAADAQQWNDAQAHLDAALRASDLTTDERSRAWLAKVRATALAKGDGAAKTMIRTMAAAHPALSLKQIAETSLDLAQSDHASTAVDLLVATTASAELAPDERAKLERVVEYCRKSVRSDGDRAKLQSLGYTGGDTSGAGDDEKVATAKSGAAEAAGAGLAEGAAETRFTVRQQAGNYVYAVDVPESESGGDASRERAPVADASTLEQLRELGYASRPPVPPIGGANQSQSLFVDSGADADEFFVESGDASNARARLENLYDTTGAGSGGGGAVSALDSTRRAAAAFDLGVSPPLLGGQGGGGGGALLDSYLSDDWEQLDRDKLDAAGCPLPPSTDLRSLATSVATVALGVARPISPLLAAPTDVAAFEANVARAAAAGKEIDVDALVRSFLSRLAPTKGEAPRDMFFRWFGDHPFVPTAVDHLSTFGMDVDTASYNLARNYLANGNLPPKPAIRTEEFVNAFRQGLAAPAAGSDDVFAITTELAPSPFGGAAAADGQPRQLLRVGLKAREIAKEARRPAALTLILDVSGSMQEGGRLDFVKSALHLLVQQLDERDTLGVVVFSDDARRVLDPTRASSREAIFAAIDRLVPEQSTNTDAGLRLGYAMAVEQLRPDADNRVILCSDGVANAGITDPAVLAARLQEYKSKRIGLTTIGVGMNNHNDALMEQLADHADGACYYVDNAAEAKEVFVDKLTGTLTAVARDAKIQVDFSSDAVRSFRQLGYENRALAHRDFRNDRVDAGEVGAGAEVVALYELELQKDAVGPIATVRCRYEDPRVSTVREQARPLFAAEAAATVAAASPRFRLDAAVAEFAELLRQSVHARDGSFGAVVQLAEPLVAELAGDPDVPQFVALVEQAARLPDLLPRRGDLARAVDEIKKVRCWQEELRRTDPAGQQANAQLMGQLEEQNRALEQALRAALAQAAGRR